MGKSPGALKNQNVNPMISQTGSRKPAQWLTDPYSYCCSTPADKELFLFFLNFELLCCSKPERSSLNSPRQRFNKSAFSAYIESSTGNQQRI